MLILYIFEQYYNCLEFFNTRFAFLPKYAMLHKDLLQFIIFSIFFASIKLNFI